MFPQHNNNMIKKNHDTGKKIHWILLKLKVLFCKVHLNFFKEKKRKLRPFLLAAGMNI
jgi:predicted aldo/keto reductase-like oxidoreductase